MNLSTGTIKFLTDGAPIGARNVELLHAACDFAISGYSRGKAEWNLFPICKKMEISYFELDNVLCHAYYMIEDEKTS